MSRRNFLGLYKYLASEFLFSFFVSFLFFFFIFFVNQILLIAEQILSKNVNVFLVLKLLFYSLPSILAFSFPFGALVGALMAIGRLSSDNEILAFQALGIPYSRMLVPIAILGIFFSASSFLINDIFLPLGTIKFSELYREILYSNPELELSPYSVKRYQNSIIITGEINENDISDLVIIDETAEEDPRVIFAKNAKLNNMEEQNGVISLELTDIFLETFNSRKKNDYDYLSSESMIYNILLKDISFSMASAGPREMSSRDVKARIVEKKRDVNNNIARNLLSAERAGFNMQNYYYALSYQNKEERDYTNINTNYLEYEKRINKDYSNRSLQLYLVEYYKKFSLPFSCFFFVMFAFPVGLFTKRSGRSFGFGIGLLVSVVYWAMLFAGQTFGMQNNAPAWFVMWIPDVVIAIAAIISSIVKFRR